MTLRALSPPQTETYAANSSKPMQANATLRIGLYYEKRGATPSPGYSRAWAAEYKEPVLGLRAHDAPQCMAPKSNAMLSAIDAHWKPDVRVTQNPEIDKMPAAAPAPGGLSS